MVFITWVLWGGYWTTRTSTRDTMWHTMWEIILTVEVFKFDFFPPRLWVVYFDSCSPEHADVLMSMVCTCSVCPQCVWAPAVCVVSVSAAVHCRLQAASVAAAKLFSPQQDSAVMILPPETQTHHDLWPAVETVLLCLCETDLQFLISPLQGALSLRQNRQQGGQVQAEDGVWGNALRSTAAVVQDSGLKTTRDGSMFSSSQKDSR